MKNLKHLLFLTAILFLYSCGGDAPIKETKKEEITETKVKEEVKIEKKVVEEAAKVSGKAIGVGPITKLELTDVDATMAAKGMEVYKAKCTACHKWKKRYIGPALSGITERRTPEWIMNMILNPTGMLAEDPDAMALLKEYSAPMSDQSMTEEDTRAILEFFREQDNKLKNN